MLCNLSFFPSLRANVARILVYITKENRFVTCCFYLKDEVYSELVSNGAKREQHGTCAQYCFLAVMIFDLICCHILVRFGKKNFVLFALTGKLWVSEC